MISLILLFLMLLLLSAFFSSSEMALVSADKLKLRERADAGDPGAQKVLEIYRETQRFLTTLLVGNNGVNVATTAILAYILKNRFGIESEWAVTAIMAPLLIILCEMVPKDYGRLRSNAFLLKHVDLLAMTSKCFYVPTFLFLKGADLFLNALGVKTKKNIFVNEEEFRSLIEESVRTGVVNRYEKKIIDTILDFERIVVSSVMMPLESVPKVDITATVGIVKDIARQTHSRMVLVYEEAPTLVVGMIYVFDLLFESDDRQPLRKFLRSPVFLPRQTSIEMAFLTLQSRRQSYAVVTDTEGEAVGAVPIERLLTL